MTPEDPRAARTRARLRKALLDECARHPLAEVSVAVLVRRAGVGRATFAEPVRDLEERMVRGLTAHQSDQFRRALSKAWHVLS